MTIEKPSFGAKILFAVLLWTAAAGCQPEDADGQWLTYVSLATREGLSTPAVADDRAHTLGKLRAVKLTSESGDLRGARDLDAELVFGDSVQFSSDGQWLAYLAADSRLGIVLKILRFKNGTPGAARVIASFPSWEGPSFAWSPDDDALAYIQFGRLGSELATVVRVPVDTLEPELLAPSSEREHRALTWFEDRSAAFDLEACGVLLQHAMPPIDTTACSTTLMSKNTSWGAIGGRRLIHRQDGVVSVLELDVPESAELTPVAFTEDSTRLIMKYRGSGSRLVHFAADLTGLPLPSLAELGWAAPESPEPLAVTDTHFAIASGAFVEVGSFAHPDQRQRVEHRVNEADLTAFLRWQPRR